jgi:hypothetical protein
VVSPRALVPAGLLGMLTVAGLSLSSIYSNALAPRLLFGAAAGSIAISVAVKRFPAWTAAPVSALGLAGYLVLAVRLSAASGGVPGGTTRLTVDALRNGIPRLLTAMIPIEPQPDTVVVPVLAVWLAGLAGAEIALRGRRVLLGYAPPTLVYAGGLYLVGPNARPAAWQPLAYGACAVVGLAASARNGTPAPGAVLRLRLGAGAAAGLAAVALLSVVLAPTVAYRVDTAPTDPRRYLVPPRLDSLDENPLARLSGWALSPDQHLFDVDLTGTKAAGARAGETRVRLAVLGDYDGVTWRVGATYRSAGRVLAAASGTTEASGREVEQKITIADLDGRLLPAVPTPRRVDGVRVAYDQASGTLALPSGLTPGLGYTVVSDEARPDVNRLPGADVPSGPAVARFLGLGTGSPPAELQRLAGQLGEQQGAPYQRALAIEEFIGEHYLLVGDAPSGHAYPNLMFFLFGPRNGGGQRGTSEQFAASFAVLGRLLGLPTRVVVGFRVAPGTRTVRGADALAWPEVLFTGVGWVPFDPLPQPNTQPRPVEEDFLPKPNPSTPPPSAAPTPAVSNTPPAPPRAAAPRNGGRRGVPAGTVLGAAGAVLLTVVVAYLVAVPLLRRRQRLLRLYSGEPRHRIGGAWREVLDALRLAGRPPGRHLSASEVAGFAATAMVRHAGNRRTARAPALDELAGLVNAAVFGPPVATVPGPLGRDEPEWPVPDEQAVRAIVQALSYVEDLRTRQPWWRRLLWAVDPRPLAWARFSDTATRAAAPDRPGPGWSRSAGR